MAVVFEGPRLFARRLQADDGEAMLAVYGDAEAMRWVGDGRPLTAAECERWLAITADNYLHRGYGMFALVERETGAVVGFCGLVHPGGRAEAEIKYAFLRSAWGRGLASEAARALLGHGATAHGLQAVIATVAPDNLAAARPSSSTGARRKARTR